MPDGLGRAAAKGRAGGCRRPRRRVEKKWIETAYRVGEATGLPVWCTDQAGPYQTIPYAGQSWRPVGWERWQEGLSIKPTLLAELPPLRMLLVLDNLASHKTPELVCWLIAHGIMPLYTPVGGSWLNMVESLQRILKRRALDGQHPGDTGQIIAW